MRVVWQMLRRDLAALVAGGDRGSLMLPVLFFLAVAMIYPFAVGPDAEMLRRTGGGIVWVAALLAAILPIDRLVAPDLERGVFDQLAVRGIGEETSMAIRMAAHWLAFAPLLLLATLPAAILLGLDGETLRLLALGLLAGTPGLAAIGVLIAALTASVRAGSALAGLLMIPLAIPILIFGAGGLSRMQAASSGIALAAAFSLALVALTPFAAGAALRAARDG